MARDETRCLSALRALLTWWPSCGGPPCLTVADFWVWLLIAGLISWVPWRIIPYSDGLGGESEQWLEYYGRNKEGKREINCSF